ncbi:MAG: hypothetical protein H6R19_222 [Proteobacteria bacterium]|nr:hypothetical protein [Pseudomonadota bacterium]
MNRIPLPFPVEALPPTLRAAVEEASIVTQAPLALIASSALAAASLAVQAKYDVKRYDDLVSPCSLYVITIAESGERKTTVDRLFMTPFEQFEAAFAQTGCEAADSNEGEGEDD